MKKIFLLIFTLFTVHVYSQDSTKVGLGVSFGKGFSLISSGESVYYPVSLTNIYVTIDVSPTFRIEPEIGILRSHTEYEDDGDVILESTSYNLRYGVGLLYAQNYEDTKILVGGRVGTIHNRSTVEYSSSFGDNKDHHTRDDVYFGFSTGGEYMFSDHFSIGGEAQLNYIIVGQENNNDEIHESILSTRTMVVIRFYY